MIIPDYIDSSNFTPLFQKLNDADTRFVINYGGTAAGKSFSAAQKELIASCNAGIKTLIIRKVGNTLRDSVIPSFRNRIEEMNLSERFAYNKTDRTLTNKETGAQMVFRGLDDPDKLKSFEGLTRILVEEAAELDFEDFLELNRRARGKENIQLTLTFNPVHEEHWLKQHFFDREYEDATIIHSTYKDNPYLTEQDKEQIEQLRLYDNNQYRVYALGEWGVRTNEAPWLFAFDKERHLAEELPLLRDYPVHLSFDFNRDPLTCIAVQMSPHKSAHDSFIHIIKEFAGQYSLQEICTQIRAAFAGHILYVTGDASGSRGDITMERADSTYYRMIQGYLGLPDRALHLNRRNLAHHDSRLLLNTLFTEYPNIRISAEGCPGLVNDCIIARTDEDSPRPGTLRKDRGIYKMDLFDCLRYFFQRYFGEYKGMVKKNL
ncbi:MAG: PBSX family phage terminase large subunit [Chitinophagaceae bacterium]|nr:PBSX family phage terminase large subunit [Chitinophagaceae bacterium]